jgi:phosphoglycerate dehydrogenase-like enzyme
MHYLITLIFLFSAAHSGPVVAQNPVAVNSIIAEFNLTEADIPMRAFPGWAPRRVVVSLPAGMAARMPQLEPMLAAAAGKVELVIDRSADMSPGAELLEGADAVISLCTRKTMEKASPRLLWLHSYTVGVDGCSGLSAQEIEGRVFTNSKRLMGPGIAEHSIAMLMSIATGLPAYQRAQAENRWDRSPSTRPGFGELKGKTLLVVGLGGIGTEVAWRAHGLGMRVIATRNSSREGPKYVDYVGLADELPKLAAEADVIVNALPLTPATTGLFDAAFFRASKPGAIFISVGRGASTDSEALVAALQSGHLFGAGLDVTDPEPLPPTSPLWQMENVIITPHISATGEGSWGRVALVAVENLRRYVAGEPLLNVVDMEAGY